MSVCHAAGVSGGQTVCGEDDSLIVRIPRQEPIAFWTRGAAGREDAPLRPPLPGGRPLEALEPGAVTVIDDRPLVSMGLRTALGEISPAGGVVVIGRTHRLLDSVRDVLQSGGRVVVLLDDADDIGAARAALAEGAHGVVLLSQDVGDVIAIVQRVSAGDSAVTPAISERLDEGQALRELFSPREREALALYARGLPAKSVARRMGSSVGTVRTYVKRLRAKAREAGLAADTRLELADLARRIRLE